MSPRQPSGSASREFVSALVTLVFCVYFAVVVVLLHFLRPDLHPSSRFVSEYAVGDFSVLMTTAFFSLGIASLALAYGLYRGLAIRARSTVGLVLMILWSIGVFVAAIFPIDIQGAEATTAGALHSGAAIVSFSAIIPSMILVSLKLRKDKNWESFRPVPIGLSCLCFAALVGLFIGFRTEHPGLFQRFLFFSILLWILVVANKLRK